MYIKRVNYPKEEIESINKIDDINCERFRKKCNEFIDEEMIENTEIHTTTSRFILYDDNKSIGEVGIRITLHG